MNKWGRKTMPSTLYGPLGSMITYDQRDIDEMVHNAKRPDLKLLLTDRGEYGNVRIFQQAQAYLLQDFTASPFFKIQHKRYADWQTELKISDPEAIIKHIIKAEALKHKDNPDTLADNHLRLLKQNYRGHLFATPYHLLCKIAHPLGLIVALDPATYSPGTNNKKSTDIYYEIWSGGWILDIKDQLKIIDPQTGTSTPIQFSVKAVLPTDIDLKSPPTNGFKLTQITLRGNRNYINAFDCFLCNNKDWEEAFVDLGTLLKPLTTYVIESEIINPQIEAANKLKQFLSDKDLDYVFPHNEIAALKQPGPLNNIVKNLGFLIAIKFPELYQALGIGRSIYPTMPAMTGGYHRIDTL